MSVELAVPLYMGLSCLLSLCYTCMQSIKQKGKINTDTQMYLISWAICSSIVASVVGFVSMEFMANPNSSSVHMHMIVALILVFATLIISSFMVYWTL